MILCAGEALIDMLPRTTGAGAQAFQPVAGGSVFNTAIALGRLGAPVGLCSGVSTDLFGEILAQELAASQVSAEYLVRSDRPTTLAFVTLTGGQASYAFYDENTAGRMIGPFDLPAVDGRVTAGFFGGISLAVEPCAQAFAAFSAAMSEVGSGGGSEDGRAVMLDPNIRPGFIRDEAQYRARLDGMLAQTDIVKVSDEDAHWLMGPGDLADVATGLLAKGPKLVCITEGAKGVTAFMEGQTQVMPADKAEVVDTVGAGDTFNAGLLAGLHQAGVLSKRGLSDLAAEPLLAALSLGARAAAVTVARAGANPPWASELA